LANRGASPAVRSCWDPQHHHDVGAVERVLEPRGDPAALAGQVAAQLGQARRQQRPRRAQPHPAPSLVRHSRFERATRECARSPTIATSRAVDRALGPAHRRGVEQRLGRVLVLAVAGVDHRAAQRLGQEVRRAAHRVAHDHDVGAHRVEVLGGVEQRLALGRRAGRRRDVDRVGAEPLGRDLERRAGARRVPRRTG
jgi:hypothetical protein